MNMDLKAFEMVLRAHFATIMTKDDTPFNRAAEAYIQFNLWLAGEFCRGTPPKDVMATTAIFIANLLHGIDRNVEVDVGPPSSVDIIEDVLDRLEALEDADFDVNFMPEGGNA